MFVTFSRTLRMFVLIALIFVVSGCNFRIGGGGNSGSVGNYSEQIEKIEELVGDDDQNVKNSPHVITGVGYAVISSQPAETHEQKRLLAIRVARLVAIRDLAEQIHGIRVDSDTLISDIMVQNDSMRMSVRGLVRGARTVRINPLDDNTYEVVVEVDRKRLMEAIRVALADVQEPSYYR